jgi:biopolymer transport protein ExbD
MAFGKRRKRGRSSALNLAPLIDINANLLFFMMINAAVQEDRLEAGQRVELPESSSTKAEAGDLISIVVGKEHISVNEIEIMKLDGNGGFFPDDLVEGQERVKPLYKDLTERFQTLIRGGAQPGSADDKLPVILVQADRGLPYATVKTVMRTCGQAGFTKFRFAAKQG